MAKWGDEEYWRSIGCLCVLALALGVQGCASTRAQSQAATATGMSAAKQSEHPTASHKTAGNSPSDICDQGRLFPAIAFEPGSSELVLCANRALDEYIKSLRQHPDLRVEVAGHTDSLEGSDADKKALSLQRAQVVYDYLIAHGVPPSMLMDPVGYGSERLLYVDTGPNGSTIDQEAARLNRRVDLTAHNIEPRQ